MGPKLAKIGQDAATTFRTATRPCAAQATRALPATRRGRSLPCACPLASAVITGRPSSSREPPTLLQKWQPAMSWRGPTSRHPRLQLSIKGPACAGPISTVALTATAVSAQRRLPVTRRAHTMPHASPSASAVRIGRRWTTGRARCWSCRSRLLRRTLHLHQGVLGARKRW